MTKPQLRQLYRQKRMALSDDELLAISRQLSVMITTSLPLIDKLVHIFLPIKKHNEINTYIIKTTLEETFPGLKFTISRSSFETGELEHISWKRDTVIEENAWGIPEPVEGTPVDVKTIDIAFVPLLAFDHGGNRIGYGKGFYDRFLARCRKDCLFVGLSHFPPADTVIIPDNWDVPLHKCITPQRIYNF